MKTFTNVLKRLWDDESGQGMTEYILILVIVIAVALVFKDQIKGAITGKIGDVSSELSAFGTN